MDSNHRRYEPADLQSAPFGHSGKPPFQLLKRHKKPSFLLSSRKDRRFLCICNVFLGKMFAAYETINRIANCLKTNSEANHSHVGAFAVFV